jgi:hypothetical protein
MACVMMILPATSRVESQSQVFERAAGCPNTMQERFCFGQGPRRRQRAEGSGGGNARKFSVLGLREADERDQAHVTFQEKLIASSNADTIPSRTPSGNTDGFYQPTDTVTVTKIPALLQEVWIQEAQ